MLCLKNTGVQALSCAALLVAFTSNVQPVSAAPPVEICNDGVDNDRDGTTDCEDGACAMEAACNTPAATPAATTTPGATTAVTCANGGLDECLRGCDSPYCRAWHKAKAQKATRFVAKQESEIARIDAETKAEAAALKGAAKSVLSLCEAKIYDAITCNESADDWDDLKVDVLAMAKVKFVKNQDLLESLGFDADGTESVEAMGSKPFVLRWLPRLGGWGAPRPAAKPATANTSTLSTPMTVGRPFVTDTNSGVTISNESATDPPCDEQEVDCKAVMELVWSNRDCDQEFKIKTTSLRPATWAVCRDMIEAWRKGYCREGGGL